MRKTIKSKWHATVAVPKQRPNFEDFVVRFVPMCLNELTPCVEDASSLDGANQNDLLFKASKSQGVPGVAGESFKVSGC